MVNSALHSSGIVAKSSTGFAGVKAGMSNLATLRDPIWHVSSGGEVSCKLLYYVYLLIEYIDSKFPTNIVVYSDGTSSWVPLGHALWLGR